MRIQNRLLPLQPRAGLPQLPRGELREEAEFLAPPPNLQMRQDQMRHERITESDERRMAE
jgi:hypothetical protein